LPPAVSDECGCNYEYYILNTSSIVDHNKFGEAKVAEFRQTAANF